MQCVECIFEACLRCEGAILLKEITMGRAVIMGRATWESLPRRPLPGRRNIVVTCRGDYIAEGADTAKSVAEAVAL